MFATILQEVAPPPAGGSTAEEVLAASAVAAAAIVAVVALGIAHRRRGLLDPLARLVERRTGLPAWAALPVGIAGTSLLVAVWGYYWDVSIHIDQGRDAGAFGNPAHWFIIVGLDGIAFSGILSLFLGDGRSASGVRITERWSVPVGGLLLAACGAVALAGFPLDDIWHRLFGQDVTAWGPTHIQMIGGASLSTIACWVLMVEGRRAVTKAPSPAARTIIRTADIGLAGAFLIGLSTLQVEFDFGVPQFRLLEHPVLVAVASSIALVTARVRTGRGGALLAVAFFLAMRGLLSLAVAAYDRVDLHFPLYLAAAVIVELVALAVPRGRPVRSAPSPGSGSGRSASPPSGRGHGPGCRSAGTATCSRRRSRWSPSPASPAGCSAASPGAPSSATANRRRHRGAPPRWGGSASCRHRHRPAHDGRPGDLRRHRRHAGGDRRAR